MGSGHGGFVLYVLDGRLTYVHNYVAIEESSVTSDIAVGPGQHELAMRYERLDSQGGTATLSIDGVDCGSVAVDRFTPVRWSITGDGLTIGRSMALPVTDAYRSPFTFTGTIRNVVVTVDGEPGRCDLRAHADQALRAQ